MSWCGTIRIRRREAQGRSPPCNIYILNTIFYEERGVSPRHVRGPEVLSRGSAEDDGDVPRRRLWVRDRLVVEHGRPVGGRTRGCASHHGRAAEKLERLSHCPVACE